MLLTVPGYEFAEKLFEGRHSLIYRGIRLRDGQSVILKALRHEYPTPDQLAAFRREYAIARKLKDCGGVVPVQALEKYDNTLVIVSEDMHGESLATILARRPLALDAALKVAIGIVDALSKVHQQQVMHNDINPRNIIWNPHTGAVRLTDFGIATELPMDVPVVMHPLQLEGSLPYIAPEQTGRMNRAMDYRTDYYSLGVTLYEMFTGSRPFLTVDPLEMVHCHMAVNPQPLHEVDSSIPPVLSDIVLKLMAKAAEDRYQSAFGVKADLVRCLERLTAHGHIRYFPIARQDISPHFRIPQKLYGREAQVEQLLASFNRVSEGACELLLVGGYSGVGKSALVNEIQKPVVSRRGYFISGKFDQYKRDVPYDALRQAGAELIQLVMAESEHQISRWRSRLQQALGTNAGIMTSLLPELELIIGPQPEVPVLPAAESQNRFNYVFLQFIRVFCSAEHPLVIFLDDLQWAGNASMKMIELMMTDPQGRHLLLVGSYRSNEVDDAHPLKLLQDSLTQAHAASHALQLNPLSLGDVQQLLHDTLPGASTQLSALAQLCFAKTLGNPFFLNQLLHSLYREQLITFDMESGTWHWDLQQISGWSVSDNVVELMVRKIRQLSTDSQRMLQLAACIGNRFELNTLALLAGGLPVATMKQLWEPLVQGLILPLDKHYFAQEEDGEWEEEQARLHHYLKQQQAMDEADTVTHLTTLSQLPGRSRYRFLHDQVRQAAYSMLAEEERKHVHLQIGRYLQAAGHIDEETLFDLVNHLNVARDLLVRRRERVQLAELNLQAARRAKLSNAYEVATHFLDIGIELLLAVTTLESGWQLNYTLAVELHVEHIECVYLSGRVEQAHLQCRSLLEWVTEPMDRARILSLQTVLYANHGRFAEALDTAIKGLRSLDVEWPDEPPLIEAAMTAENQRIQAYLADHRVEELLELPAMSDPRQQMISHLLGLLWPPAINVNLPMSTLAVVRMVTLSMDYGNAEVSPFGYGNYGSMLSAFFGQYQLGRQFGQLSVDLIDKTDNLVWKCKVYTMFAVTNSPWSSHLPENIGLLQDALRAGLDSGDVIWTGYSSFHILKHMQHSGHSLTTLAEECDRFLPILQKVNDPNTLEVFWILRRSILLLQGQTDSLSSWNGGGFDEEALLAEIQANQHALCLNYFHYNKMQAAYLFGRYDEALDFAEQAKATLGATFGWFSIAEHNFYYSLILTARMAALDDAQQQACWKQLEENQQRMADWMASCPANFAHKYYLVAAEMARLRGDVQQAMDYYDQAIDSAYEQGFSQGLAIANELASLFWLQQGKNKLARVYMLDGHNAYLQWGATAKVQQLEARYPQWMLRGQDSPGTLLRSVTTSTSKSSSGNLDLLSVMKALQIISTEIVLEQLLQKMMQTIITEAGAQQGTLVLRDNDQWLIQARGSINANEVAVLEGIPVMLGQTLSLLDEDSEVPSLPLSIIAYVTRTREPLILDQATEHNQFVHDPYIQHYQPRSVICHPLLRKEQLIGILYLENNLIPAAFTPERLQVLDILASQAAISIDHALLYDTLEQRVNNRTLELNQAKLRAEEANRAKSLFLATMSHEIRTPMNAVIGLSRLMQQSPMEGGQRNMLEQIQEAGEGLLGVINDILDYSKNEANQVTLERIDFRVRKVIERTLVICSLRAREKNLNLRVDVADDVPDELQGDPLRLQQILINLVSNAVKFTAEGEVRLRLERMRYEDGRPALRFIVSDTGIGIDPRQLGKLFQPFSQVDDSITRQFGGTGLGLAICKQLVELMDGTIQVQSVQGEGSTFTITLPMQLAGGAVEPDSESLLGPLAAPDLHGIRLLLVDDNAINRQVALGFLKDTAALIEIAGDGQEAVDKVLANPFDLVLMDIQMPRKDGLSAAAEIRRYFDKSELPIIAMTAHALPEDRERSLAAGMNGHLNKPLEPDELYRVLRRSLARQRTVQGGESPAEVALSDQQQAWLNALKPLLDIKGAIQRLQGKVDTYLQLVEDFSATHQSEAQQLVELAHQQQWPVLYRRVHTLRTSAAYLGAASLVRAADELERLLGLDGSTAAQQSCEVQLQRLCRGLEQLLPALQRICKVYGRPVANHSSRFDVQEFVNLLQKASQYLDNADFAVEQLAQTLTRMARGTEYQSQIEQLGLWIDEVEFERAGESVSLLLQQIAGTGQVSELEQVNTLDGGPFVSSQ